MAQARDIKGRIYVNEQGINAQLSGYGNDAVAYADWVTSDERFAGTRVSVYDAPAHSFPRLTLRYKANLVQLEGGTQHLDLSTPEARAIYKERAATAECVNAWARNHGMRQFRVRGLRKIKAVVLWFALAYNAVRAAALRRQAAVATA